MSVQSKELPTVRGYWFRDSRRVGCNASGTHLFLTQAVCRFKFVVPPSGGFLAGTARQFRLIKSTSRERGVALAYGPAAPSFFSSSRALSTRFDVGNSLINS